ncbi:MULTISPECIES: thiol peroxidase [Helicobacter]|uniref:Thiol peroxidase n=1 Tax=Helicobacter ibis TaxID=2962633 RepID=A0ABT4VGW0_9HELI|nr:MULTISPECIES: thiol peroxidase [Helicobacter]MDA3967705.1 thiol peroxidase [Helicobacter sp. WB40]MDA3969423.1 thiol peroxidase [Helicobacter ibis]
MRIVSFKDQILQLLGDEPTLDIKAPKVLLRSRNLSYVEIAKETESQIIMSLPSLDTSVCSKQTKEINQKLASKEGFHTIIVSMDLPFAANRFCAISGISNLTFASDYANKSFGYKYGTLIGNGILEGLLSRALFVIDKGILVYKDFANDINDKLDFNKIEDFLAKTYNC